MRARISPRIFVRALSAVLLLAAAGCASGTPAGKAVKTASPAGAPRFSATTPPGFSTRPAWSSTLTWDVTVSSNSPKDPEQLLMAAQAESANFAMVGTSVVGLMFAHGQVDAGDSAGLQFRTLATGALLKTVHLPHGDFSGISTDTVSGRPVLVVRYTSTGASDEKANAGKPLKITAAYAADGLARRGRHPAACRLGRAVHRPEHTH